MRSSDWSSDVCSSDLVREHALDLAHDSLDPFQHIIVPEPDHPIPSCFQIGRARFVFRYINRVLSASDSDDEFGGARHEVADGGAGRELAIEANACKLSGADLRDRKSVV